MRESRFQSALIRKIKKRFPGCIVLKTDPTYIQGFPDLLILYRRHWFALECKKDKHASVRPNQKFYINKLHAMSYASFIYPENEEEILNGIQKAFGNKR